MLGWQMEGRFGPGLLRLVEAGWTDGGAECRPMTPAATSVYTTCTTVGLVLEGDPT